MILILKMAFRDLARNRRRSFFSALALAIGVALLLFIAGIVQGEMRGAMETSIKLQSGHLQVRAGSYNESKTSLAFKDLIENPDEVAAQVASLGPVQLVTPRLYASGIITQGDNSTGVRVMGIDPTSPANAPFIDGILSGEFLKADDRAGVLIGRPLAEKLKLQVGGQVDILVNTSNGDINEQLFTVRGIYSTGTPFYDETTVLMPLAKAQAISATENHASILFVLLKDRDLTPQVQTALKGSAYQVVTFEEMNPLLTEYNDMANSYMIIIYFIVLLITAAVIINTLIMAVFERTREIGILSAIGMKSTSIMAMFFAESFYLAVAGIIMGLLLGSGLVQYFHVYGFFLGDVGVSGIMLGERIFAYLSVKDMVSLSTTAFIITLLAALYPALLAARMEPVEAMRGGKQQ